MSAPSSLPSGVVLLIQPERDDRDMYARFLRHAGMTPIIVSDAAPALVLARDSHVIVTELLLPDSMDGIEFIERLKNERATNSLPIIVLTSSTWDAERARRAGCDLFLAKPCLPDRLLHEIRRLLAKSATWTRHPSTLKFSAKELARPRETVGSRPAASVGASSPLLNTYTLHDRRRLGWPHS